MNVGALLDWASAHGRDLPWRQTRDPWAVLVVEVMSQQTQVVRVAERWPAFLQRFGDPTTCAEAPLADVLRCWHGMGYPRRAQHLHRAATACVERHGGAVPDDLDELLDLPGVGPYTARAVLAFAFERDVGLLDTNTGRVLARQGGRRLTPSAGQAAADALVPAGRGWAWNQAMLDLGATVCRPRAPHCGRCPVRSSCAWAGEGADPAARSAAVSRPQARFEGSLRQRRGALMAALVEGPVAAAEWADDVVIGLVADGLVDRRPDGHLALAE